MDHPPLPLARLEEEERPHERLEQKPLSTRRVVEQRGDRRAVAQPMLLLTPPELEAVPPARLLPERTRCAVLLLRPRWPLLP